MGGFQIMAERCGECLFGKNKIVGNARRAELLREIRQTDGYFICHKASIVGRKVACHGDWEQNGCGQLGRIAQRLNALRFVSENELAAEAGQ